jgi:hypothetical protein
MKIKAIYDDGGESLDRYTVVYDEVEREVFQGGKVVKLYQGIGQHCTAMLGRHLGKRIKFEQLPVDCQRLVKRDLAEVNS